MRSVRSFHLRRFLRNATIIVAVLGLGAWGWFGFLRERVVAKRFGEVTATVFRSGQISEHVIGRVLDAHGIKRIVDLTEPEYMPPGKVKERELARERGIEVLSFPLVGDGTGDVETYANAVAALIEAEREGKPTLVHCAAGTYRTSGVVAYFRMLYQGWSQEEALREAKVYDWSPSATLPDYLAAHREDIRARLAARGLLANVPSSPGK